MSTTFAPGTEIERGAVWSIVLNRNQNLLGKLMLVLERPCDAVIDLTSDEWSELHKQVRRVMTALDQLFQPDQYNYSFLMNEDAQVHLHVIPRYELLRSWDGVTVEDVNYGSLYATHNLELPVESLERRANALRSRLPGVAS